MKREYLINSANQMAEFHHNSKGYVGVLDATILDLQNSIVQAQTEIEKLSRLREVVAKAGTSEAEEREAVEQLQARREAERKAFIEGEAIPAIGDGSTGQNEPDLKHLESELEVDEKAA